jgi:imidazolonepropionase-like amidohydrolase
MIKDSVLEGLPTGSTSEIDATGLTLLPGLIDGHAHLSFHDIVNVTDPGDMPPEESVLWTAYNARAVLMAGFTSCFSAASTRLRNDVVIRNEINAGRIVGPRLRAASPEITATGSLGDANRVHQVRESFGIVVNGPIEMQACVRLCIREGCDVIKINIGGEELTPALDDVRTTLSEEEIDAACKTSHGLGRMVAAHCRGSNDVKLALKYGVDCIYHCDFADAVTIAELGKQNERVFVGPAVGLLVGLAPDDEGALCKLEAQRRTYPAMRRAGVRAVIGGDYGFRVTPQGQQARDLMHFVQEFGYTPAEALVCATKHGGQLMGMEVGQVKEGYLADLLLVSGDPLEDVRVLQDQSNIRMIMQDGFVHKDLVSHAAPAPGASSQGEPGVPSRL